VKLIMVSATPVSSISSRRTMPAFSLWTASRILRCALANRRSRRLRQRLGLQGKRSCWPSRRRFMNLSGSRWPPVQELEITVPSQDVIVIMTSWTFRWHASHSRARLGERAQRSDLGLRRAWHAGVVADSDWGGETSPGGWHGGEGRRHGVPALANAQGRACRVG